MARPVSVSVVVTNHNYGRFLPAALASVLRQADAGVQIVVVDDGSTDGSRAVLARYEQQVRTVLKEQGGQSSAFNAGFAAADGDVVLFLDADDELRPGVLAAVRAAFAAQPAAVRVAFRLELVDEDGRPTGTTVPPAGMTMPDGDVRAAVLAHADDLAWPPTSGNAWAAWALRRVLPLPVSDDPVGADSSLHALMPLLGPVVALDVVGGAYRMHGQNSHLRDELDVARSRVLLRRSVDAHARLDRLARELGHGGARPRSVTLAAHRLVSLRLDAPRHPVAGDTRRRALGAGLRAAAGREDVGALRRAAYAAWFVVVAVAPRSAVRGLARAAFQPVQPVPMLERLLGR